MRSAIITINYNSSNATKSFLESLLGQTDKDFQILIVDNASDEADFLNLESFIKSKIPVPENLILMRNNENLGFSGGNNTAIRKSLENGVNWVILLNNDTLIGDGFLASIKAKLTALEGLQDESRPGIVGIPLVEGDAVSYYGKIRWLNPTLKHSHAPIPESNKYAIGGAVAIHKDVFKNAGLMDEKYFLYFEDADFSLQARKSGFKLAFLEEPKVFHETSSTTKKLGSPLLLRYHYRNALYFNWKNGPWYIKLAVWPWSFWVIKKQLWKILFMYRQKQSLAILLGVFDFYRGRMGKI